MAEIVEKVVKLLRTMGWESYRHGVGVNIPAKDALFNGEEPSPLSNFD
jgi:hypothetical protein